MNFSVGLLRAVLSFLRSQTAVAPLALAVTAWENTRHVTGKKVCCVTRARLILTSVLFGYHTLHFSAGCMAVPFLQWNTSENASKFCNDPITLNKEKNLFTWVQGMKSGALESRKPRL